MIALIAIELVVILFYLFYVIHTHSEKQVSLYVRMLTLVSWLLSFGLIIIVPLEIYFTEQDEEQQYDTLIVDLWTTLYWLNFLLTWFLLPIYMEYENAGYFTFKQKILQSLKINLIFYAVGAVFTIIFTIYLMVHNSFGIKSILAFFVVLSNAFGLTIVVFLLGYALVAVPRTLFRNSNLSIKLK